MNVASLSCDDAEVPDGGCAREYDDVRHDADWSCDDARGFDASLHDADAEEPDDGCEPKSDASLPYGDE